MLFAKLFFVLFSLLNPDMDKITLTKSDSVHVKETDILQAVFPDAAIANLPTRNSEDSLTVALHQLPNSFKSFYDDDIDIQKLDTTWNTHVIKVIKLNNDHYIAFLETFVAEGDNGYTNDVADFFQETFSGPFSTISYVLFDLDSHKIQDLTPLCPFDVRVEAFEQSGFLTPDGISLIDIGPQQEGFIIEDYSHSGRGNVFISTTFFVMNQAKLTALFTTTLESSDQLCFDLDDPNAIYIDRDLTIDVKKEGNQFYPITLNITEDKYDMKDHLQDGSHREVRATLEFDGEKYTVAKEVKEKLQSYGLDILIKDSAQEN